MTTTATDEWPRRIAFVVRALPAQRLGGLEYHARDLIMELARRGYVIDVVSTEGAAAQEWGTGSLDGQIRVHEIPAGKAADYSLSFFWQVNGFTAKVCREWDVDVLIPVDLAGLTINGGDYTCAIFPLIHGTLTSEVPLDGRYWSHLTLGEKIMVGWRYKARLALMPLFKRLLRRSKGILVDSEFTRRELDRIAHGTAERIRVAELGIDLGRYPAGEEAMRKAGTGLSICTLGRLQEIKGVGKLLEAAKILNGRGVDFSLDIGGTGSFAERAAEIVDQWGLKEKVRLTGRVAPGDVATFMRSHDVFVFPDLTQPAFGLVAVEAMRYGLPVVAGRVGAVPEVVTEETGWLYDAWNATELAEVLETIAARPDVAVEKGLRAKERSELFTAECMADRFLDAVRGLTGKSER